MCIIKKVQILARSLFVGIQKLPQHKQIENKSKIQAIINKFNPQKHEDLVMLEKQLSKKLKFLQLAHPKISFQLEENQNKQQSNQKVSNEIPKFVEYEELSMDRQDVIDTQSIRQQVNFSNWADGNIDPQHLKRHKYLLDRQHFMSPEWQNKPLPTLSAVSYLQMVNKTRQIPEWDKQSYRDIKEGEQPVKNVDDPTKWETFRR